MSKVEGDMKILLASKDPHADPNKVVTLYNRTMTNKELAGRLTSGADMLRAMMERNVVFKVYESEMKKLTASTALRINALLKQWVDGVAGWGDHQSRDWSVPKETSLAADGITPIMTTVSYHGNDESTCRGGGFLGLARRRVFKRWHHQFFFNSTIFNDPNINEELAKITYSARPGEDTPAAVAALKAAMNLPTGKYMIAIDHINSHTNYAAVRNDFKAFIASLKTDPSLSSFNHEPELLPLEAKDCTEGSTTGACSKFPAFLDGVAKIAYAQNYAYSTHNRSNYKFFFNGDVWRKKLFKTWTNQLDYLTKYYTTMAT
jgi:hypothetical protein